MRSFIDEVVSSLYGRYGDDISSLNLVFPSRRARLFFSDALSRVTLRPVWQPRFVDINDLMQQISGIACGDRIKLVTALYKVYSRHHDESFDEFYFWGDMLLSDFDQIDKYLIDADVLFTNIGDLHALEDHLAYLTPEQIGIVSRFWQSFGAESNFSDEKARFMSIWRTLGTIYHEYRAALSVQGLAYEGMVHRIAAERIAADDLPDEFPAPESRYVIVGFNALSACEKRLFTWLRNSGRAEFWWDYDDYYVGNADHEAGLFLRSNIREYPAPLDTGPHGRFVQAKKVSVVSAPSDSLQCKYVHTFLEGLLRRGLKPDKETAIVLTDESLLLPVLYSIPDEIGAVNVTMGYPLRQTTAYSFVERLLELQRRKRRKKDGTLQFYHSDVVGILNHPYILEQDSVRSGELIADIQRSQRVYVEAGRIAVPGVTDRIFSAADGWTELADYLQRVLACIGGLPSAEDGPRRREFFSVIIDNLCQVGTSLRDSGLEVTVPVFSSLLRKILQGVRIPYEGEPLSGIQVMGILETRNLDFENVLILSANDDTFPGNLTAGASFIPHNLRLAYGLPTPMHHEGVYAYYFYRLLQRASVVHIAYCSRSDDKHTGEPSRYIYQLDYESPHDVVRTQVPLSVSLAPQHPLAVPKTGEVAERLYAFLDGGGRTFSPTSFYAYIECPLKFCFRSIERLRPEEEVAEEIDLPMFGTILHKAMELLYTPLLNIPEPGRQIRALIGSAAVADAVTRAVSGEYLRDPSLGSDEYGGNVLLVRDIVARYIGRCILPYDAAHPGFRIEGLEQSVTAPVSFCLGSETHTVTFAGTSDRLDRLTDGRVRVVDYKTGAPKTEFRDLDALFSADSRQRNAAALQTLLYSMMVSRTTGSDVQPALYYVRRMNDPDYSPLLVEGKREVFSFAPYRDPLQAYLQTTLASLFDFSEPFRQCDDRSVCEYCDFREICRR